MPWEKASFRMEHSGGRARCRIGYYIRDGSPYLSRLIANILHIIIVTGRKMSMKEGLRRLSQPGGMSSMEKTV